MRFHTIVTHANPHLDEITAIWLLRDFGEESFPGVKTARLHFWTSGGDTNHRSADQFEQDGFLLVGVGRGRFDEHPSLKSGEKRKENESAATLVARGLNLDGDPALERILTFVKNTDLKGKSPFDLASLTQLLYGVYPEEPGKVIAWAIEALRAKYREQLAFYGSAEEFAKAKVIEVSGPRRTLRIVIAQTEAEAFNKYALSSFGRCDLVIRRLPTGNVQIFTGRTSGLALYDVAKLLRLEEQRLKGRYLTWRWEDLASEGIVPGAEEWYFQVAGQMLLNGSRTAENVPATKIPLERIEELVTLGVNPQAFEPSLAETCRSGHCAGKVCPWYDWGLSRCRTVRFKEYERKTPSTPE